MRGFRKLTDLVEEERAAGRFQEMARASRRRSRKGSLFVTEELGFDEFGWNGAAVDGHEPLVSPRAGAMDGASEKLLAGTRLPFNQHRNGAWGNAARPQHHALHGPAPVQNLAELRHLRRQTGIQAFKLFVRTAKQYREGNPPRYRNGTEAVWTPCCLDDSISSAGKRVFARMIQMATMAGVPGLRWNVSELPWPMSANAISQPRRRAYL